MCRRSALTTALVTMLLVGCTSSPPGPTPTADAVPFQEDPHLQKVWLADGFRFTGDDALLIAETRADVPTLNPDSVENLEWAKGYLRDELAAAIRKRQTFRVVSTGAADLTSRGRTLRLDNTIVEYEKGGGGARFFAGLYGAGQPVIRVHGRMTEEARPVFVFEARRSGETGLARMFGGYRTDQSIQEEDIQDLAKDLADFIHATATGQKRDA